MERRLFRSIRFSRFSAPFLILALALPAAGLLPPAAGARHQYRIRKRKPRSVPYRSALLLEGDTGRVLKAYRPRRRVTPASLVKMMTVLLTLEEVRRKSIRLTDVVRVSRAASRIGGQQVYLKERERFPLRELMKAVMISSANDAAYAVAEYVAGSAGLFVRRMNRRARRLGMTDTRFVNVHGLPERRRRPQNRTSARDMAHLSRALLKHPIVLPWTTTRLAYFRNGTFMLNNTNRLIGRYPGADGLKTGSYRAAGYSVVATARRNGLRLIAIVLGARHPRRRFTEARRLLSWGFRRYAWYDPGKSTDRYTVKVADGVKTEIGLRPDRRARTLIRRGEQMGITSDVRLPERIHAPVEAGQPVGKIVYLLYGKKLSEVRLVAAEGVARRNFLRTLFRLR